MTDAPGPVYRFEWRRDPINRHTLKTAGIAGLFLAFAIISLVIERHDQQLIAFAWAVLLTTVAVIAAKLWPYLTIRGPVVEIGPDGILDRRKITSPVRWRHINQLYAGEGCSYLDVRVRPGRGHRVTKWGVGGFWQWTGWGLGSFVVRLESIDTRGEDIFRICRDYLSADKAARLPAIIAALERVEEDGLQGPALDAFVDTVRDLPLLIPMFEQHHAQRYDVVEEEGGAKVMYAFTDDKRYYEVGPQGYYSPAFPDDLFRYLPCHGVDALVINPRVGPSCRIPSDRFAEMFERLCAAEWKSLAAPE